MKEELSHIFGVDMGEKPDLIIILLLTLSHDQIHLKLNTKVHIAFDFSTKVPRK